jgi:acyl transferase domain-containing protein
MQWSLLEELSKSETESIINKPEISQTACIALQISWGKFHHHIVILLGLFTNVCKWVLASYGVKPSVVVGHSGEIATYAGILSSEDAIKAAVSKIFRKNILIIICQLFWICIRYIVVLHWDTCPLTPGKMAAVSISEKEATVLINSDKYLGKIFVFAKCFFLHIFLIVQLAIAAVNSPNNVTLSGDGAETDQIVTSMKEKNVQAQVSIASPSYIGSYICLFQFILKVLHT